MSALIQGLNAILDHRTEVYIPELNQTFSCPPSFRVFACQNPSSQGGGRKGLPKSFLNRFTKVLKKMPNPSKNCLKILKIWKKKLQFMSRCVTRLFEDLKV